MFVVTLLRGELIERVHRDALINRREIGPRICALERISRLLRMPVECTRVARRVCRQSNSFARCLLDSFDILCAICSRADRRPRPSFAYRVVSRLNPRFGGTIGAPDISRPVIENTRCSHYTFFHCFFFSSFFLSLCVCVCVFFFIPACEII